MLKQNLENGIVLFLLYRTRDKKIKASGILWFSQFITIMSFQCGNGSQKLFRRLFVPLLEFKLGQVYLVYLKYFKLTETLRRMSLFDTKLLVERNVTRLIKLCK